MFIAMVSTLLLLQSRLYTTLASFLAFFVIYWELGSPLVVLKILIWKKKSTKKNTSLELRQVTGPHHGVSSYYTRGPGAGAQAVLSDTLLPRGSKRRYKSFEYSTTTTTTTQLTPTTTRNFINSHRPFCDPVVPGRRLKVGFEPISIIMLLPPCWLLDFISLSTNHKIEFYYDRERHITREVV
jgi:hypothetical protein